MLFDPFSLLTFAMCRSSSPRAYALRKLPCEVTRNIDSFRDFKLEAVIKNGGTPSALAMKAFKITNNGEGLIHVGPSVHHQQWRGYRSYRRIDAVSIRIMWVAYKSVAAIWLMRWIGVR